MSSLLQLQEPQINSYRPGDLTARPYPRRVETVTLNARKQAVREFLAERDLPRIRTWAAGQRSPLRTLMSLTFDAEELIRWRAVEAVGPIAADQAKVSMDRVREFLRRLIWLMNDESGGVSWLSPEMIGEVLRHIPSLISEYAPMLPSFLSEEPFERGTHLALWRVAGVNAGAFQDAAERLRRSLDDPDPAVRAFAAKAVMEIDPAQFKHIIMSLGKDNAAFTFYDFDTGQMRHVTVAQMVTGKSETGTDSERVA